ncbi:TIGR04222 domain-containing membrane protein [Streptomyces sp. NPDC059989]|uniref:TIGR04222 domain-containing membrane protein n=1 Tax=Streptomyces sp. NPDC059989 TaxID=3347026 RepID=UPI00368F5DC9
MNLLALAIWLGVAVSGGLLIRGLHRSLPPAPGPAPALHDLSEAAFMAGGPGAVVDTALVSMLGDGRLVVGGPGIVHVRPGARAYDPAERAVLQAHQAAPSGWLYQVRYAAMLDPAVQETGDALAARGLLSPPGWGRTWRRWGLAQVLVCLFLIPMAVPLTFVAYVLRPGEVQVPFIVKVLPVLLAGIVAGGLCMARAKSRITPEGARAQRVLRSSYVNDRTPHVQTALFGLRGLRDPFLRGQLVPAARATRLAAAQSASRPHRSHSSCGSSADVLPVVVWCAGSGGGGGSGCGSGSSCGSSGSSCSSSGSGSSCGGGSSSCSGSSSSCSSSSGSSCSSSSSSS